jgi:HAD superfamily hydrolase (TIGR01549 family)
MKALDTLKEIPGTVEAIRKLAAKGYRLGVLTRSNHAYAEKALEMLGVRSLFKSVLGRGDTPQPKPYADAMIYAAKDIGLPIENLVLIGDHHIDSTCAVNAKCRFIGVATGGRGDKSWEVNRPAVILPSVADLPEYLESNLR